MPPGGAMPPDLLGLHAPVLVPPAVKRLLADLQPLTDLTDTRPGIEHRVRLTQLGDDLFRAMTLPLHRESPCPSGK